VNIESVTRQLDLCNAITGGKSKSHSHNRLLRGHLNTRLVNLMREEFKILFWLAWMATCGQAIPAESRLTELELPPIETALLGPIELESISIWVPARKIGPTINRASCSRAVIRKAYSFGLPIGVQHTKSPCCPQEVARLLAEHVATHREKCVPITIFNGWQWEYSNSLCQFSSGAYTVPPKGHYWENSWEAILSQDIGFAHLNWVPISLSSSPLARSDSSEQTSNVEVLTFSSKRTRDGYPKNGQLK
jgi:hypothetical protein